MNALEVANLCVGNGNLFPYSVIFGLGSVIWIVATIASKDPIDSLIETILAMVIVYWLALPAIK